MLGPSLDNKVFVKSMERALDEGKYLDRDLTELAEHTMVISLLSDGREQFEGDEGVEDGASENKSGLSGRLR